MEIHPARLVNFPIFDGVPPGDLHALVAAGQAEQHTRGHVLFREGDRAKNAFLVVQGRLGVYLGEGISEKLIGEVKGGEVVGEAGLMNLAARRNATVRALTDVDLLKISPRTVMELSENAAMVAIELYLLSAMARRIRAATIRLEEALSPGQPPASLGSAVPGGGTPARVLPSAPYGTVPPGASPGLRTLPPTGSPGTRTSPPGAGPGLRTLPPSAPRGTLPPTEGVPPPPKTETLTQTLLRILGGK